MSERVHYDDCLPDFGTGGCTPACRITGYVLGDAPNNPLMFKGTTESLRVTCRRCIRVLIKRITARLNALGWGAPEVK